MIIVCGSGAGEVVECSRASDAVAKRGGEAAYLETGPASGVDTPVSELKEYLPKKRRHEVNSRENARGGARSQR